MTYEQNLPKKARDPSERRVDRYVQDVFICSQDMQRDLVFFCMYKPP